MHLKSLEHLFKEIKTMFLRQKSIEIINDNPFANCKLERKKYADVLTTIVKFYSEGFVFSINNEWGTGKTTFVKMWQQQLRNDNFKTIYFNAWENDFDNNPLVAIISELQTLKDKSNEKAFKSILKKGAVLAQNVLPAIVKSITEKYIDTEELVDVIHNTSKAVTEIFEAEIKEYTEKKKSIRDFREELENFLKQRSMPEPVIFIIDELDRCRPNYAVDVLEQLKHFFSVPGIVFVLSVDKRHLASSIRGFYGSESINTDEYLRRFIDLEYSIPSPSTEAFCRYLYDYYSFDSFFQLPYRTTDATLYNDGNIFLKITVVLLSFHGATLRQSEKIFSLCRLVLKGFSDRDRTYSALLFYLIFLKTFHIDLYRQIESKSLPAQKLSDEFTRTVPLDHNDRSGDLNFLYIQAQLIWFYNNSKPASLKEPLIKNPYNDNDEFVVVTSKLDNDHTGNKLSNFLNHFNKDRYTHSLDYLLRKINLMDSIQS